jgi:hypothetical protein
MAISYPLTPPAAPEARSVSLAPVAAVAVSSSPFTFQRQVQEHQGQKWVLSVELPPMVRADAEAWITFLLSLNGPAGTFFYSPPTARTPRGVATGAPLVNGAAQTGQDLVTNGWTAGVTGILLKGDLIQLGTGADVHLHKVLEDADSDGGGNATLTLWPNLRESPVDASAIVVSSPKGLFALLGSEMAWDINVVHHYGIGFAAVEAL